VKTACTANESMRQNHLQIKAAHHLSNYQEHNTLNFPALWPFESFVLLKGRRAPEIAVNPSL
jgi:hypothetical protein